MPSTIQVYEKRHTEKLSANRASTSKMIGLHVFAMTMTSIIVLCGAYVLYLVLPPLFSNIVLYLSNVFLGQEKGVVCKYWNINPWEQLQCTWTNYVNGVIVSLLNSVLYDIQSRGASFPTLLTYCWAFLGILLPLLKYFRCYSYWILSNIGSLYRKIYHAGDNPHNHLEYIHHIMCHERI